MNLSFRAKEVGSKVQYLLKLSRLYDVNLAPKASI